MDKLERAEQMAKAIVEYFIKHELAFETKPPLSCFKKGKYINMGIQIHRDHLEKYLQEAILDFEAEQSLKESIKDHDETYERITGEKING
jgi:hypothetical protein